MAQDLARMLYHRALEYAPDARAYWGLGLLAEAEGDERKAEAILQEGMLIFPEDDLLARTLVNILNRQGKVGEARELMRNRQNRASSGHKGGEAPAVRE